MDLNKRIVIIGGGPTGLGAAVRLKELGYENWVLLEQDSKVGGLSSTERDDKGFLWDVGGHVAFSHYKYYDDVLEQAVSHWIHHEREAWVWLKNTFVPYPFQNNIHRLPDEDVVNCLKSLIQAYIEKDKCPTPKNFDEWLKQNFGAGLYDIFLLPYNEKVWAFHPSLLSSNWMGDRVAQVNIGEIVQNTIMKKDSVSWGPNSTFQFPKYNGTGSIWESIGKSLVHNVHLNTRVTHIDAKNKIVTYSMGERTIYQGYDYIINTIPLDELLTDVADFTQGGYSCFCDSICKLAYNSTHVIGVGLKGEIPDELKTKCWLYFPEKQHIFYRCTIFSNYSSENAPVNHWSLMFEVNESEFTHKSVSTEDLKEGVIAGAIDAKLINKENIVSIYHKQVEHGYPIPTIRRDEALETIQSYLMSKDIYSRGRFGGYKYEVSNMDHSFMQGVEAVDKILFGIEEQTYFYPEHVNGKGKSERRFTGTI